THHPSKSTLFPYTTLFRSVADGTRTMAWPVAANTDYTLTCKVYFQGSATTAGPKFQVTGPASPTAVALSVGPLDPIAKTTSNVRSEEHTSELQSRGHLVCR